jgi:hypothetical protein
LEAFARDALFVARRGRATALAREHRRNHSNAIPRNAGTKPASRREMRTTWKLVLFLALVSGLSACEDDGGSPPPVDAAPSQDSGPPPLEP